MSREKASPKRAGIHAESDAESDTTANPSTTPEPPRSQSPSGRQRLYDANRLSSPGRKDGKSVSPTRSLSVREKNASGAGSPYRSAGSGSVSPIRQQPQIASCTRSSSVPEKAASGAGSPYRPAGAHSALAAMEKAGSGSVSPMRPHSQTAPCTSYGFSLRNYPHGPGPIIGASILPAASAVCAQIQGIARRNSGEAQQQSDRS
eukprot:gnl/TRDRNA2_/TRDRNA2_169011_c4_seq1.p1 gnl/TRDRNA2_/TRDRNA2_169011_c4~~gnl/TRDRNA2_/TRDRNA2_169011_c4_seq1.p1  ORF type:complete len:204 (-),score=3.26 gnl/TRDRNA2_/TRDRNA2_169011_c4_seq1:105-716(-)